MADHVHELTLLITMNKKTNLSVHERERVFMSDASVKQKVHKNIIDTYMETYIRNIIVCTRVSISYTSCTSIVLYSQIDKDRPVLPADSAYIKMNLVYSYATHTFQQITTHIRRPETVYAVPQPQVFWALNSN